MKRILLAFFKDGCYSSTIQELNTEELVILAKQLLAELEIRKKKVITR
jgi:hypothetical protein